MTSNTTQIGSVTGVAPMFLVDDVVATAEWYRDTLGFHVGEYYSDDHEHDDEGNDIEGSTTGEVFFVILDRDGHRLMLGKTVKKGHGVRSNFEFKEYSSDAYFWCEGVDAIFEHARASGAVVLLEPETQFYGIREFRIKDHDGRVLTFGGPPNQ